MSHALLNTARRTAAGLTILVAVAAATVSPAHGGSIVTSDCVNGFGYDFNFGGSRSYHNGYGNGYGNGSSRSYGSSNCVRIRRELTNPFVIQIPQPDGDKEVAEAESHERAWRARCRPVIREDAYGVRRYHYAAPGCEYGKYE